MWVRFALGGYMIRVTAFKWVPPFAQGLVRDLRVRWALEEAEIPHEVRLISFDDQKSADYRKQQPFGQVPVLEEDGLTLFESGSIVLHIADQSKNLMPATAAARARTTSWVFAALNTLEPQVMNLAMIDIFRKDKMWAQEGRPDTMQMLESRLRDLDKWLDGKMFLEGESFTAADLMMTTVLRNLRQTELLEKDFPRLGAYKKMHEARPAFQRALAAQMKPFSEQNQ